MYTLIFCQASDGKFIVVEKDRPAKLAKRLNLVGGKIEVDEMPLQAARRELLEETGIEPRFLQEMGKIINNEAEIHCFFADTSLTSTTKLQPREGETEKPYWSEWKKVRQDKRLMPNLRLIIPMMLAMQNSWVIEDNDDSLNKTKHKISVTIPGGL